MFNRKEQRRRIQLNHEKHEKTRKKQKRESVDICVSRNNPLTCLLLFLSFLYFFCVFSCFSW